MTTHSSSTPFGGRFPRLLAVLAVCAGWPVCIGFARAADLAEEAGFYSGGKFHPVIVSQTEFAVELAPTVDRTAATQRMRSAALGVLQDVPWKPADGRLAILRTDVPEMAARLRTQRPAEFVSVNPVYRLEPDGPPILSSGRIVVRLRQSVTANERDRTFADYAVDLIEAVDGLTNTYLVTPHGGADNVELATANALYRDPRTVYAHPDWRAPVDKHQLVGDTFYDQQWYLTNDGAGNAVAGADININRAYNRTQGSGILIGQLDDACDVNHEDLANNYLGISHNITNNVQSIMAANPQAVDERHGTAAMGIMVAQRNNGVGIRGVAPAATFTASRGLDSAPTYSQIAAAFTFARNMEVDVHNNSWGLGGGVPNPDVIVDAIRTAFDEGRNGLGMVVCVATSSGQGIADAALAGEQVEGDDELSTLSTVIGVGASNALDQVATYSNYGPEIDVLAPSGDPGAEVDLPGIVTTDNTDSEFPEAPGYNADGFSDAGEPDLADPRYTAAFGGTSASSAMVSGIAALILALEPNYTAFQVRNIIEHTCDKINPSVAAYNGITGRSLRYGYGRVNAGDAVEATFDGYYWPERVANVEVRAEESSIRWRINDDLREFGEDLLGVQTVSVLVVESDEPFQWAPTDQQNYQVGQVVTPGVTVVANLLAELYNYETGAGTKYFGIYPVASTPRRGLTYGFGVSVATDGTIIDSGTLLPEDDGGGGGDDDPCLSERPHVSIAVDPLQGESPLEVSFRGNATTTYDNVTFEWDFGDGASSTNRVTDHTYTVASGSRRFFATLTATITLDDGVTTCSSQSSVAVDVSAPDDGSGDNGGTGSVTIRISDPNSVSSDISSGFAPLPVLLNAEVTGLATPPEDLEVFWDLGDGETATSLSVAHTYDIPGVFPIVVRINSETSTTTLRAQRYITVLASTASPSPTPTATPNNGNNGNGGLACGAGAMMSLWAFALLGLRRRLLRER